ncbi:fimbrillin family protein [Bacteroides sp. CR5/BHMF/2]|nr:fimbrillin family protein [Bacteroides sp. CR5/BHMF/2]
MAQPCQRRGTILLLIPLLLASCSQDETLPGGSPRCRQHASLALSTLQATGIDGGKAATRAVTTTDYPTGKSIGFFVKENTTDGYTACNNRKGDYNTTRRLWLPTPDSIWLNNHDADIAIYAPYDAAQTTAAALNLAACLRPADGSKDIWCKRFTANNTSKNLAVTLEHVYTRLALTVTRDANYKADAVLATTFALEGNEVYQSGTYKPFDATTPYIYGTDTGLTPTVPATTLNASTASAVYDLLLLPATLTGDLTLTLTVDGKKMRVTVAKEKFASTKLEAGKQYNVNLALKPGKLEVTSVSVEKWDALAEVSGGNAEFDEYTDFVDIGVGFYIAKGNLMTTKQADGTLSYAFADEQGYYSGKADGGDLFCWNTDDPFAFSVTQSSWDDARDPCRKVSDGNWRTPTDAELKKMIDAGNVWGEDIYTMKDGTTKNGCYFGTPTVPAKADQDNYVFLPAAGSRDGNTYINAGTCGYYWSATLNASDTDLAYGLGFYSSYCGALNTDRYLGFSLRCVKDIPLPAHCIDIGLDFYVADGNVTATKEADGSLSYAFADEQGYYSGKADGGDLFCWNTIEPFTFNVTHSSWDDARDPCRKVGDGNWRTPTDAELKKMIDAGNVWGENIYTMKDGTTKNGRYFGTTAAPAKADQDKYVFLPAADGRYGSSYVNAGTRGCYWGATLDTGRTNDPYYLNFNSSNCNVDNYTRYYGFSLRCVHNK